MIHIVRFICVGWELALSLSPTLSLSLSLAFSLSVSVNIHCYMCDSSHWCLLFFQLCSHLLNICRYVHWQQICETLKINQDQAQTCSYEFIAFCVLFRNLFMFVVVGLGWDAKCQLRCLLLGGGLLMWWCGAVWTVLTVSIFICINIYTYIFSNDRPLSGCCDSDGSYILVCRLDNP